MTPRVLVVCTANQCRSPLGEAIVCRELRARGRPATVRSAGTDALAGVPATEDARAAGRRLGLDIDAHRSRPVTADLAGAAELVLCMEHGHVLDLVQRHGSRFTATYTVPELALAAPAWPRRHPDEPFTAWLERSAASRTPTDALSAPEIADPVGRSARRHRAMLADLDSALRAIFTHLDRAVF